MVPQPRPWASESADRAQRIERAMRRIYASLRTGEPPFELLIAQLADQHDLDEDEIVVAWTNTPLGRWIEETDNPAGHFRVTDEAIRTEGDA